MSMIVWVLHEIFRCVQSFYLVNEDLYIFIFQKKNLIIIMKMSWYWAGKGGGYQTPSKGLADLRSLWASHRLIMDTYVDFLMLTEGVAGRDFHLEKNWTWFNDAFMNVQSWQKSQSLA